MPQVKIIRELSAEKSIDVLVWPRNRLDLNPIENLWQVMKSEVANQYPTSMESLTKAIKMV